jgi:hypothetical protein
MPAESSDCTRRQRNSNGLIESHSGRAHFELASTSKGFAGLLGDSSEGSRVGKGWADVKNSLLAVLWAACDPNGLALQRIQRNRRISLKSDYLHD